MGDVIVAPVVLTLASGEARRRLYSRGLPSFFGLVVILVAVQFLLFDRRIPIDSAYYSPVYVIFPLLIFTALRFGTCGTAITIFITASIAILKTVQGLGPFTLGSTHQNLISLQLFMFVAACTSLIMAVSETRSEAAKASLDRSEQRYRSLVLATSQVVWSTDSSGEVIEDLPTWEAFTGQSKEEVAGRGWITKVHPDDLQRVTEVWDRSLAHGTPHEIEFRVLSAAGRYRNVLGRAVPILESNGKVREWVGTLSDITDKKRTEEELRQSNRRKDEFLAMLAHELRNPLAPIRNAIEIIRVSKRDPERVDRTCDLMERQVHNMSRLLDDLLDIARITRGQIELRKEPTDLRILVERSVEAIRPTADKKALQLTTDFERVPVPVAADVTRLEQVVTNLLNNAVKFTPAGGRVIVRLVREKEEAVLRVCDNGRGIEPDLLPNIFELFVQGDRSLARSEGGLGIGLTLVQNLVRMHSGTVAAASGGAGFGSEFTVRLPLMSSELLPEVSKPVQTAVAGQRKRVLVVEDNTDSAETLAAMLDIMGHEAHIAHDGHEGLAEVARLNPSVVLLDIGLPGMTGFEVAEQLRSSNSNHSLMLIALTGYGSDTDRARSKAAGFDHHLVKPVDFGILEKLLNL
jgi:PAS domain S-box-containing protein